MSLLLYMLAAVSQASDEKVAGLDNRSAVVTDTMMKFGRCVAKSRTKDVESILRTKAGSNEELSALLWTTRTDRDCDLSGATGMRISQPLIYGVIFEAYYHHKLIEKAGGLSADYRSAPVQRARGDSAEEMRSVAMTNLGACVSRKDPPGTQGLLQTRPMTNGEVAVTKRLAPAIAACRPTGAELEMTQQELRAVTATGLVNRLVQRTIVEQPSSLGSN